MARTALPRSGATGMKQANRLPTRCMMGANRDWLLARRFLMGWAATSRRAGRCTIDTKLLWKPIFLFLFSIFCFHGPGQHFDYRRRRGGVRYRARRFFTLARRFSGRAISKAGHGYQHAQQRREPLGNLLYEEFAQGAAVRGGEPAYV